MNMDTGLSRHERVTVTIPKFLPFTATVVNPKFVQTWTPSASASRSQDTKPPVTETLVRVRYDLDGTIALVNPSYVRSTIFG
jgi:hypothetical protein